MDDAAHGSLGTRLSLAEAVTDFLRSRTALKQAANTLAAYRRDLAGVGEVLARQAGCSGTEQLAVSAVTGRTLRAAFAEYAEPRAASSIGRAWSVWNQFFTFLVADDLAPGNPMGSVGRPKAPHRFPKPLRGEDTPERLLESAAAPVDHTRRRAAWPERDFAVLAVLLCAGLRSTELLELSVSSVGGRRGERILTVRGKGGKERAVPVEPELEAVIEEYLESRVARFAGREPGRSDPLFVGADGLGLGRGGLQYLVARAYREAGVSGQVPRGASVHALRHTFATRLAEDGASAVEIMRLLGHASLTTSQNYIDSTAREQRAAIRASRTSRALRKVAGVGVGEGPEAENSQSAER